MSVRRVSRREFVRLAAATAAGSILAACAPAPAPVPTPEAPPAEPVVPPTTAPVVPVEEVGGEAPMLAELVQMGQLPPLEERLPTAPKVITPIEDVGLYCDKLRHCTLSVSNYICTSQYHEALFEFPYPDLTSGPVEPNLAESWSFNEDGTVLTVNLRRGTKWSDGQPFTTEDVLFLWEDVWFEPDSLQAPPGAMLVDGEPPQLVALDDFTLQFTFPRPFYYSENNFAALSEWAWPKHYMKQFHPKYNPEATWEVFSENTDWWEGRGAVTLQAWMLEDYHPDVGLKKVRNPYYFKVDTAGNQLPYADRVEWNVVADRPTIALKCIAGEIDYDGMWVGIPQIPLFFEEKDTRGFDLGWYEHVVGWKMSPNYDHYDPEIREVLRDVTFRRALSLALDRNEMNRTFYYDQAIVFNACFSGATPFFDDECAQIYSQYDPDEARRLLDEGGYLDVDGDGYREMPNGKPLDLVMDVYQHDLYVPLMEMVVDQLKEVGLKAVLNIQMQDAAFARRVTDEWMFWVGDFDGSDSPLMKPQHFIPVAPNEPWWHQKAYEEPMSPEYEEFTEILKKATGLPRDEMISEMKRAAKIMADQVWMWSIGSMRRPYFIG